MYILYDIKSNSNFNSLQNSQCALYEHNMDTMYRVPHDFGHENLPQG